MNRDLSTLAGPTLASALTESSVVVLPTGAIEHHGPHLPLATDYVTATTVAAAAVDRAVGQGVDAWLLPGLAYTKSDEHHWAPGTVWLSWDTLMRTLVDIGRSVAMTPARKLLFVNGHGGNTALLSVALRELRVRFGLQTFLTGTSSPAGDGVNGPDELGFGIHGGHAETSMMLHLRPELVDMTLAERNVPEQLAGFTRLGFHGSAVFGWQSDDFTASGVIGDPTGATAEWGVELFERSVASVTEVLGEVARFERRPDAARPPIG
ncbi:creatininase family protein [Herbiconiux sp. SYSU D00978]|uniref:creatininase family protein n=1 Tax=Herbiconiux sp. SYSU D00978 TaxID=2812562 RepID=UPI001A965D53|nr:creatininase family protein [Herbiconiux sp. SYSU D00978]